MPTLIMHKNIDLRISGNAQIHSLANFMLHDLINVACAFDYSEEMEDLKEAGQKIMVSLILYRILLNLSKDPRDILQALERKNISIEGQIAGEMVCGVAVLLLILMNNLRSIHIKGRCCTFKLIEKLSSKFENNEFLVYIRTIQNFTIATKPSEVVLILEEKSEPSLVSDDL